MKKLEKMNSINHKLLWELIKNCRRSDRAIAKVLKTSQPTITRRRAKLEKSFIEGYTAIPRWRKIGFELIAFNFVKTKVRFAKPGEREAVLRKVREWMMKQPNVIFASEGQGMGWSGAFISLHKNFSDFAKFMRKHDSELSDYLIESQSFTADLNPEVNIKPFHFKYLSEAK